MVALKDYRNDFRLSLIESGTNDWAYKFNDGFRYGILLDGKLVFKTNDVGIAELKFSKVQSAMVGCLEKISKLFA